MDATRIVLPEGGISLDAVERDLIAQALVRAGGNKVHAARLLGVTYDSIRYQVKKLGLEGSGPHTSCVRIVGPGESLDGPPPPELRGSSARRPLPSP
jgi:hypothetical protein